MNGGGRAVCVLGTGSNPSSHSLFYFDSFVNSSSFYPWPIWPPPYAISQVTRIRTEIISYLSRRMRWAGHVARMGEERGRIGSWWGNRRERDHWGDLGLDGWIILGWISRRWDVGIWTGLGWPTIGTVGGRL